MVLVGRGERGHIADRARYVQDVEGAARFGLNIPTALQPTGGETHLDLRGRNPVLSVGRVQVTDGGRDALQRSRRRQNDLAGEATVAGPHDPDGADLLARLLAEDVQVRCSRIANPALQRRLLRR
jgi:hypothetical protein